MSGAGRRVCIVGGGPGGLLAALRASAFGAEVFLLEKMPTCGLKLRLTGKGRCNLTNTASFDEFLFHFGPNGRFLKAAFSHFFNQELVALMHAIGVETMTERGGRVFPVTQDARRVAEALIRAVQKAGAKIYTRCPVTELLHEANRIAGVRCRDGTIWTADAVVLACGGASYPATGSTGDGYHLAQSMGHAIVPIRPALVPLFTEGDKAKRLQGLTLRHVKASVWIDGRKIKEAFGEMLFTHEGLSGPIILTLSREAVDGLMMGKIPEIRIDFKPALDDARLDARLLHEFQAHGKEKVKNTLKRLLPAKAIPVSLEEVGISSDKPGHQIRSEERKRLRLFLKGFRFHVSGHGGWDQALITAGGVSLKEIDPRTLGSRIIRGLYLAGEMLNLDADTGGYNLQAAFSTGWLAGESAATGREP